MPMWNLGQLGQGFAGVALCLGRPSVDIFDGYNSEEGATGYLVGREQGHG